ncbi:MAG TPA: polyphosphate kinase 1 [Solirubrobacterales bacterium]|nr:polyphosphate kinase 1 [Solirubrobacterales bacterium]
MESRTRVEPTETEASAIAETSAGAVAARAEAGPDLEDPSLYFNRELSWLQFNDRVLQLAEDTSVPLLERVKFCAIWESNLDEFYMVRVANLHDQLEGGIDARGADGMSPREQIDAIQDVVSAQRERVGRCFEHELRPALAERGIRLVAPDLCTPDEQRELERLFRNQVFPVLTPLVIGLGRPFPYISNLSVSLAVVLHDPDQETEVLARVKVPKELLGRFVQVGGDETTLVALDDLIAANIGSLFPGMDVVEHSFFRVTRDTDYDVSDEADDLLQAVEEELRRRRFGEVVRLEVDATMNPRLRSQLVDALKISENQVYEAEGHLDLADLWDVVGIKGYAELREPPHTPVTQPRLMGEDGREADVFAAMREGDILVHHPYDSFTSSVERFVKQAVDDPDVLAIKQTVYRTSADSPLVPGLIDAAERGKQAVCLVELKARFDERANIRWAKKLEEAGVHVVYGIPALKTHCKCVLVVRREGDGVRHYVHVGTGNYNPKTARIYTDIGLFTCDPEIGSDIAEMFNYLTGYARPRDHRKVLVAPFNLRQRLLEEIELTIAAHSPERSARIRLKMNSLLDAVSIRALYRASQAGVKIELNVRGICALRPGVEGVSQTVEVVSVVGRFLEHSRIFSFERPGEPERVYIGSADWMPRNLYNRVELVTPVDDAKLRAELMDVLDRSLADNTNAWVLGSDGEWSRRRPAGEPRSVQRELIDRHQARASEGASR